MRKSRHITLTILGAAMLAGGCGRAASSVTPPRTYYDASKTPVPREHWLGPDGKPVPLFDEFGNPVPPDEVTAAYTNTNTYRNTTNYRRTSPWWGPVWWSSGPSYYGGSSRPAGSNSPGGPRPAGSTYYGGSKPNTTAPATSVKPPAPAAGSHGGFGSTGASAGS